MQTWAFTRNGPLHLCSVRTLVTVMNYRVSYPGQVTHVASPPTTFRPIREHRTNIRSRAGKGATATQWLSGILLFSLVGAPGVYDSLYKLALLKQLVGETATNLPFLSSSTAKGLVFWSYMADEDAFSWMFLLGVWLDVSGSRRHSQNHGCADLHLNVKEVVPDVSEIHILRGKNKKKRHIGKLTDKFRSMGI